MSWLSKGLGKIKGVGKALKWAAPVLGALPIPGISTAVAAGLGGLGGLIEGGGDSASGKGNWGGALKSGAIGGGMGALGSIGGNLIGKGIGAIKGVGGGGGGAGADGGNYDATGGMRPDNPGGFADAMSGGGGTDWGKILGAVGKYAPLAMGAAGAFQNAQNASQNRQLTEEQVAQAREAIARQKMLQDRAMAPINVQAPDYTSIFAQTQNPFYRPGA